jgi:hemerythrin-like domain-containing protein
MQEMMPIGPLMIEHRLIERMIKVMKRALEDMEEKRKVDPLFVDGSVDFIRTYADRCHHGKEEDILFRELKKKSISQEHARTMEELTEEHRWGRRTTAKLVEANERYRRGDRGALSVIMACVRDLVSFYPKHIEKEDRAFFIPVMDYFTKEEQDALLEEGFLFDRKMIHEKYENAVAKAEERVSL